MVTIHFWLDKIHIHLLCSSLFREILVEESNVQSVDSPVTVSVHPHYLNLSHAATYIYIPQ